MFQWCVRQIFRMTQNKSRLHSSVKGQVIKIVLFVYPPIYHVRIAENAPRFMAHGIMRFDNETVCPGYSIIGINIKQLPTMINDKIDIIGNIPDKYAFIIRLTHSIEIHPTIQ